MSISEGRKRWEKGKKETLVPYVWSGKKKEQERFMERKAREIFNSIDFEYLEREEMEDIYRDIAGAKQIAGEEDRRIMEILQEAQEKAERRKNKCRMG